MDTIAETVGKEQVSSILKKQWERKAEEYREQLGDASLRERVATLVKLRRAEGYMAEFHPVAPSETQKGGESHRAATSAEHRFLFLEHNCAISNVAESFPSVCGHELEMFAAVLPDCTVERTQWIINGEHRCGYLVQAREE